MMGGSGIDSAGNYVVGAGSTGVSTISYTNANGTTYIPYYTFNYLMLLNDLWKYDSSSQAWTWMSGSSVVNQTGTNGTQNAASASFTPGARESSVSWTDKNGKMWLFGGIGFDSNGEWGGQRDVWKFDPATNMWNWVSGATKNECTVSSPSGNYGYVGYPGVYGSLNVTDSKNHPSGRVGALGWTDSSGNSWLMGGSGSQWIDGTSAAEYPCGSHAYLDDLWEYDSNTDQWTWRGGHDSLSCANCLRAPVYGTQNVSSTSNWPGSRYMSETWTDSKGRFWMFGGFNDGTNIPNDLWLFDPSSAEWTWISGSQTGKPQGVYGTLGVASPANTPGSREGGIAWIDDSDNLWMLGGSGVDANGAAGLLNDLWKFDTTTLEWTWEAGSSLHDVGGTYGTLNTPSLQNVPGGRENGMAWTDNSGDLVLFGGVGYQSAIATHVGGDLNDLWLYQMNVLDPQASAPVLSPAAGTYTTAQSVTISDATSGAIIYYTTDGTTPTTSSTQYTAPITVDVSETIQAIAVASGYSSSSVASAPYIINLPAASAPTFSPSDGTYTSAQTVTMSDATPGAAIYYTTDGSTPTTGATKYTGPVTVNSTETLLAIAEASGYSNSATTSATFVITATETYAGKWVWMGGSNTIAATGVYGSKGIPDSANTPGAREEAATWTDASGNLWLFGGGYLDTDWHQFNDLWEFTPSTKRWAWMSGSNTTNAGGIYGSKGTANPANIPGARDGAAAWADASGNLWLFGGKALFSSTFRV
jgi:N-acetylneuraminic acid mutarotase